MAPARGTEHLLTQRSTLVCANTLSNVSLIVTVSQFELWNCSENITQRNCSEPRALELRVGQLTCVLCKHRTPHSVIVELLLCVLRLSTLDRTSSS